MSVYNIVKNLKPLELFEIVTRGVCNHHLPQIKREIENTKGKWYLENWDVIGKLDILKIFLSNNGFLLYTTKEEAKSLEKIFKSWDIFYSVNIGWYGGSTYVVSFQYDKKAFMSLYSEWKRNKKLIEIGI